MKHLVPLERAKDFVRTKMNVMQYLTYCSVFNSSEYVLNAGLPEAKPTPWSSRKIRLNSIFYKMNSKRRSTTLGPNMCNADLRELKVVEGASNFACTTDREIGEVLTVKRANQQSREGVQIRKFSKQGRDRSKTKRKHHLK